MGSLQTITFLRTVRESPRHSDREPPGQTLFSFERPHTCIHCETVELDLQVKKRVILCWDCQHNSVGKIAGNGEYVCSNCGRPSGAGDDLRYTATLDHNIPQAVDATQSGCELYRWVIAKTARAMPAVSKRWEVQEVMDAIAANCRFEVLGVSSMNPGEQGQCVLNFQLVCSTAASEDLQKFLIPLGELLAWAASGDPASKYILSRPYGLDVTSSESLEFAKDCFSVCMDRHPWCRTDQIGHLALSRRTEEILPREKVNFCDVPTRLVDVGTLDLPRLRLVEAADDNGALMRDVSEAGFMALSYCWGGDQQAKLLQAKVADYKRSIDPSKLSKTLQEAVWVARTTGFCYLWIDSLCIHQDDVDGQGNNSDKSMEITRMASYYGRATITLCVSSSEKAVDGFLGVRKDASLALGPIRVRLKSKDTRHPIGCVYLVEESDPPPTEPTTTRGWTLQESLLSRRILIFGLRQVYWSCLNAFGGCGGSISTLIDRMIPGVQSLVDGIYPAGSLIDQPTSAQWGVIVKDYTKRKLGREGDKLWAVAALAKHMDWEVEMLVQAAPYGAVSGGRVMLAAKAQTVSRAQAASVVSWGDWGDGAHLDDAYDSGPWGKIEGRENEWALILLADCAEDRKTIEADLKTQEPENSSLLLVAMLPLTMGNLVGVWGLLIRPDTSINSGGPHKRVGGFQLRAGNQRGGRPESSVFKFFENAETRTIEIV
ncbi:Heterokaryon incompatibility protein (HET) domain containing protein [Rhypophila decipiens]